MGPAAESFARVSLVRCREHLYDIAFQGLQAARLRPHGCEVRFFGCDLTVQADMIVGTVLANRGRGSAELSSLKFKCRPPCEGMGRAFGVKGQLGVKGWVRACGVKGWEGHSD